MGSLLPGVLAAFGASLIPGLELRTGIPAGVAMGLSTPMATAVAIIGNTLQIPFARWFIDWAYQRADRLPRLKRWLERTEVQVKRHQPLIRKWGWLGLAVFVVLPLPGTGVWGGIILSRILQIPAIAVWLGIALGIAISGAFVGMAVEGAFSLYDLVKLPW